MAMNTEQRIWKRVLRVQASGWMSFTDMALHCGMGESKMRAVCRLEGFPAPSKPIGAGKERRWCKNEVDAFFSSRKAKDVVAA